MEEIVVTEDDYEYDHKFGPPGEEVLQKLYLSKQESLGLERRIIHCPICGFRILSAYAREGVVEVKCQRCKFHAPISLRYFRRQKPISHKWW